MTSEELFERVRGNLVGVAYRMIGTMSDAEDVVQDVFERWLTIDASPIDNPEAYLTTMTTRRAIDRLGSAQKRREVYVGPWLPEPVLTSDDPAALAELDESVTMGYLYLLERLTPEQRAVHLLHEVFSYDYREIGSMIGRTEANCRQIGARARRRLQADDDPEVGAHPASARPGAPARSRRATPERETQHVAALLSAVTTGDLDEVRSILTEDVIHISDGGPDHRAARNPVVGRDRVARLLVNLAKRATEAPGELSFELMRVNGEPAVLTSQDGQPLILVVLGVVDEGVRRVHAVVNPDKLSRLR